MQKTSNCLQRLPGKYFFLKNSVLLFLLFKFYMTLLLDPISLYLLFGDILELYSKEVLLALWFIDW